MWREIRVLSKEKPVIASMSDVAASGGYYMAMACSKIVAEALTITGEATHPLAHANTHMRMRACTHTHSESCKSDSACYLHHDR
jgi:Peptidase family S49